ncbi:hypothetical protein NMY22_g3859 [Coprinellus aureogranulatus]|nr:hypothetical protein NMY22_g3859 [Coprinellus aureogranulatus]
MFEPASGTPPATNDEYSLYEFSENPDCNAQHDLGDTGVGGRVRGSNNPFAPFVVEGSRGACPIDDDVLIAVMGATGSGKTTFINTVSGSQLQVSSGLFSCTNAIGVAPPFFLNGRYITLIDTPGFDDTMRSDTDILQMIAQYLTLSYESGKKLAGVIYIHRISDFRMGGTSTRNFSMFRKLCGDSSLRNVVIMTNMWSEVNLELGEARERELAQEGKFFKPVLDRGARMVRNDGTLESGQALLHYFLGNTPAALQIQREIVEEGKDILHTAAGEEINKVLIEQKKRHERDMLELQQEYEDALEAKDEDTRREIEAATEELKSKITRIEEDSHKLASNFKEENEQFRQKIRDMESKAKQDAKRIEEQDEKVSRIKRENKTLAQNVEDEKKRLRRQMDEIKTQGKRDIESVKEKHDKELKGIRRGMEVQAERAARDRAAAQEARNRASREVRQRDAAREARDAAERARDEAQAAARQAREEAQAVSNRAGTHHCTCVNCQNHQPINWILPAYQPAYQPVFYCNGVEGCYEAKAEETQDVGETDSEERASSSTSQAYPMLTRRCADV